MESRRQSTPTALVSSVLFLVSILCATVTLAQPKPGDKNPQPAPKKDLLIVEPVAPKDATPETSPQKPAEKSEAQGQVKAGSEVDERQQLITNTDLITFNVTVTDIYGRFVSGLGKNAFTIFDDKTQQEISFF